MSNNLINAVDYSLFTFGSTSHALKAENILKGLKAEFIIIPTLREISTSCGLSIKINPDNVNSYYDILKTHNVEVEAIYYVKKVDRKNLIEKIT
ncbi:MAG: DUF3343 domain-containing protein [Syntrophomonadaceae bacterium]|jgi:hypothetical protein